MPDNYLEQKKKRMWNELAVKMPEVPLPLRWELMEKRVNGGQDVRSDNTKRP